MSRGSRIEPAAEPCTPILPTRHLLIHAAATDTNSAPRTAKRPIEHPANPLNSQPHTDTPVARNTEIHGSLAEGDCYDPHAAVGDET